MFVEAAPGGAAGSDCRCAPAGLSSLFWCLLFFGGDSESFVAVFCANLSDQSSVPFALRVSSR